MRSFSSFDNEASDTESLFISTDYPLRDVDEESVEELNEFSIKSATPAIEVT